jgi:drug/metabolite transporter (DMT)-like permease
MPPWFTRLTSLVHAIIANQKTFQAYDGDDITNGQKRQTKQLSQMLKVWMVCGDCLLIGLAPVLVHMAKDPATGKFAFSPVSVNLLVEMVKTLFALGTLVVYGCGRPGPPLYRSFRAFCNDAFHNRLLAIPGALYAINNYLKFIMQLYFKPTTAKMLSNLKIIVIALLMRSVMRRRFSVFQWEALFLLVAGITVNQLASPNCDGTTNTSEFFSPAAILYTLGSITIPSLASVYNEFALKKHMETSVLLQNFFLYFYGVCFNLVGYVFFSGGSSGKSIFSGFNGVTLALVVNNALQGILSSFFFKFADTILKKYSSTIATILTGLMSAALFGHQLTLNFVIGVSIVFISMHLFFSLGGTKGSGVGAGKKADGVGGVDQQNRPGSFGRGRSGSSTTINLSPSMDHIIMLGGDNEAERRTENVYHRVEHHGVPGNTVQANSFREMSKSPQMFDLPL